jgi:hypothetical protein
VNSRRREVDSLEQMPLHEHAEAARVRWWNAGELVQIEGCRTTEVGLPRRVQAAEVGVSRERRLTCWQTEHQRRLLGQRPRYATRERGGRLVCRIENSNVHEVHLRLVISDS